MMSTPARNVTVQGVAAPAFFYGTAWKEDRTAELVRLALAAGFRAIDTANQRKHYFEAAVGEAVAAFLDGGGRRQEIFLQTKFTYRGGQDQRLPYDPRASYTEQVRQSFASSLEHLGVAHLDSYVLHGPERGRGLTEGDREVWRAMESLHADGGARLLGASNVTLDQLQELHRGARVPPAFVQNRCFAADGWDAEVRAFCREHALAYQGFSLLTANRHVVASPLVARISARSGATPAQVIFAFALQVGMVPLTGTTDPAHMRDDLASFDLRLEDDEVRAIERAGL
jgi:diketogulonate reductase-like aldo/keto reductase